MSAPARTRLRSVTDRWPSPRTGRGSARRALLAVGPAADREHAAAAITTTATTPPTIHHVRATVQTVAHHRRPAGGGGQLPRVDASRRGCRACRAVRWAAGRDRAGSRYSRRRRCLRRPEPGKRRASGDTSCRSPRRSRRHRATRRSAQLRSRRVDEPSSAPATRSASYWATNRSIRAGSARPRDRSGETARLDRPVAARVPVAVHRLNRRDRVGSGGCSAGGAAATKRVPGTKPTCSGDFWTPTCGRMH